MTSKEGWMKLFSACLMAGLVARLPQGIGGSGVRLMTAFDKRQRPKQYGRGGRVRATLMTETLRAQVGAPV